jgi:hypothetical protein
VRDLDYAAYLASDHTDDSDSGVEEYEFKGPKPPKAHQHERGEGLGELLKMVRTGGHGDADDVGKEVSFVVSGDQEGGGKSGGVGRTGGGGDEDGLPPTVFEMEEAKRKQKRKEKRDKLRKVRTAWAIISSLSTRFAPLLSIRSAPPQRIM